MMMKKWLALLLLLLCAPALAEAPIDEDGALLFELPEGGRYKVYIHDDGWYEGFREENGEWKKGFSAILFDELHFLRRDSDDPPAYTLMNLDGTQALHYLWNGEYFAICGWHNAAWEAAIEGDTIVYTGSGGESETVPLPDQLWLSDYEDLPATPDDARALYAISEAAAATLAPGFTLYGYGAYNGGWEAWAEYGRITEDGCFQQRHLSLEKGRGVTRTVDSLLVPVTQDTAARLQRDGFRDPQDEYADTEWMLLTGENTLDRARIPFTGQVVDGDLQSHALILVTEEADGSRCLYSITYAREGGYAIERSPALPAGLHLDTFHAGEGAIQAEWGGYQVAYTLMGDNRWHFSWAMLPEGGFVSAHGGLLRVTIGDVDYYGELPGDDLFLHGVISLPSGDAALTASLERDSLAVVHNPDPADRLHLRTEPSRSAPSLGKFYSGTVVRVLEERGDWVRVRIGVSGQMTGWMMKKYLAFAEDMDAVSAAFPDLFLREEVQGSRAFADAAHTETHPDMPPLEGDGTIIGAVDAQEKTPASHIVLTDEGWVGYVPQDWYWPGNG